MKVNCFLREIYISVFIIKWLIKVIFWGKIHVSFNHLDCAIEFPTHPVCSSGGFDS